jgi:hypothetical protein
MSHETNLSELEHNKQIFMQAWFAVAGPLGRRAKTTRLSKYLRTALGIRHVRDLGLGHCFKYVTLHFDYFEWVENPPSLCLRVIYNATGTLIERIENPADKIRLIHI